jgi:putative adhesin
MLLELLSLFSVAVARPLVVQAGDFSWHRALAAGKTIEIVGVNGSIEASGTSGREVEVTAVKKGRKSDPADVQIEVVEHAEGVTICAVYPPGRRNQENECLPGGKGRMNVKDNDVNVTWTIRVPRGVRFTGRTVNGQVVARGLTAEAEIRTVNGSITVETTSWASATTVNGSISARMGSTEWSGETELSTVNGGITVDLPPDASMEVDASTVNGSMSTDFPLTIKGKWGPRRMSGIIGQGGRSLSLSTVNGSMALRRAP